jgi:predicted Rossmann-fold nucleotide-binding protein
VGRAIARSKARVVCGGYGGVMEAACRGAAEAGGGSLGVTLEARPGANGWVTRVAPEPDLAARLKRLRDESDAWIFLPRGLGTMLELVWMAESVVKGDVRPRPLVLLGDFWRKTVETIESEAAGPGAEALASCVRWAETPEEAAALAFGESGAGFR